MRSGQEEAAKRKAPCDESLRHHFTKRPGGAPWSVCLYCAVTETDEDYRMKREAVSNRWGTVEIPDLDALAAELRAAYWKAVDGATVQAWEKIDEKHQDVWRAVALAARKLEGKS